MATTSLPQQSFIVYILRRSDKQDPYDTTLPAPFYVGKGKPNRPYFHFWEARTSKRNTRKFNIIRAVERDGGTITTDIVASEVNESVAFMIERQLIHFYGRDDEQGILANRTDGGEGPTGMALEARQRIGDSKRGIPRSPEIREKLRRARVGIGHTEATKLKLAEINRGRKHTPEARQRMSISIRKAIVRGRKPSVLTPESLAHKVALLTGRKYPEMGERNRGGGNPVARGLWAEGQYYSCVKEAAASLGINKTTIYGRIQRGDPRYYYAPGTEDLGAKLNGGENVWARGIRINGVEYATVHDAARTLGIGKTSLYRGIRRGTYTVEYLTPAPEKVRSVKRPVCVNGVLYAHINEAFEQLGISESAFYRRVKAGVYMIEHPDEGKE